MTIYPKLIVPLQTDLAIGVRRYRLGQSATRAWRTPGGHVPRDIGLTCAGGSV